MLSDFNISFFCFAVFVGQESQFQGNGAAEMTCVTLLFSRDYSPIKRAEQNLPGTWLAG